MYLLSLPEPLSRTVHQVAVASLYCKVTFVGVWPVMYRSLIPSFRLDQLSPPEGFVTFTLNVVYVADPRVRVAGRVVVTVG